MWSQNATGKCVRSLPITIDQRSSRGWTAERKSLMSAPRRYHAMPACAVTAVVLGLALASIGNASGARAAHVAASSRRCKTSGLVVWIDTRGNAAAGSVYYTLKLTNESGRTCALGGYPGVSAVNLGGRQLGSPAARTLSTAHVISLSAGATTSAQLQIAAAGNFPRTSCHPVLAAGLRVYPPNQTVSKVIPIPFRACARKGPIYLHVKAVAGNG